MKIHACPTINVLITDNLYYTLYSRVYLYILPYQMITLVRSFLWQLVFLGQKFQKKLFYSPEGGSYYYFQCGQDKIFRKFLPRTKIFLSQKCSYQNIFIQGQKNYLSGSWDKIFLKIFILSCDRTIFDSQADKSSKPDRPKPNLAG